MIGGYVDIPVPAQPSPMPHPVPCHVPTCHYHSPMAFLLLPLPTHQTTPEMECPALNGMSESQNHGIKLNPVYLMNVLLEV